MEYGLWQSRGHSIHRWPDVLILVLMEYGLWRRWLIGGSVLMRVLILVLMEYGLWLKLKPSRTRTARSLNPCSNGIWSLTAGCGAEGWANNVLILVLMEYGLWQLAKKAEKNFRPVLILVLMEYGLWQFGRRIAEDHKRGLNPCSNGIWSLTYNKHLINNPARVLILVLMEYGLWHQAYLLWFYYWTS